VGRAARGRTWPLDPAGRVGVRDGVDQLGPQRAYDRVVRGYLEHRRLDHGQAADELRSKGRSDQSHDRAVRVTREMDPVAAELVEQVADKSAVALCVLLALRGGATCARTVGQDELVVLRQGPLSGERRGSARSSAVDKDGPRPGSPAGDLQSVGHALHAEARSAERAATRSCSR
jgi:hypothetical protein